MKPSRALDYLDHMIEAIDRVAGYTNGLDHGAFLASSLVQDAVIRNIEIIGEAARNFERAAPELAEAHPHIPWRSITGMRNQLTHGYFGVDLESVWATARNDLPPLRGALQALVERESARRLARMGGSAPDFQGAPRRRPWEE